MTRYARAYIVVPVALILATMTIETTWADWEVDGVTICDADGVQCGGRMASDENGGAIVVWVDHRDGGPDIYAQKVDVNGAIKWTEDGVAVCTEGGGHWPQIVSDGIGGAIITWIHGTDIYAQRLRASNGGAMWTAGGVPVCTAAENQDRPQLASDGSNGAIITWVDNRQGGNNYDIYAQRVRGSDGARLWTPLNGVVVCEATYKRYEPQIVPERFGNNLTGCAIITWWDQRNWPNDFGDIYAQKLRDSDGARLWAPLNGVPVCETTSQQLHPQLTSDGFGGAVIAWWDERNDVMDNTDIYAQRVLSGGGIDWALNGLRLTAHTAQNPPRLVPDGAGGAVVTWDAAHGGGIYAQRVCNNTTLWQTHGKAICTASGDENKPQIIADGAGGVIITWEDGRTEANLLDIYAQRVLINNQQVMWDSNGKAICQASDRLQEPQIVPDGAGGAIISWQTVTTRADEDIYGQRVDCNGNAPPELTDIPDGGDGSEDPQTPILFQNRPNPCGPSTKIRFDLPEAQHVSLKVYTIGGREVATLLNGETGAGSHQINWCRRDARGRLVPSGIYYYHLRAGNCAATKRMILVE